MRHGHDESGLRVKHFMVAFRVPRTSGRHEGSGFYVEAEKGPKLSVLQKSSTSGSLDFEKDVPECETLEFFGPLKE